MTKPKWTRVAKIEFSEGRTVVYRLDNTPGPMLTVESRLRHIPHSNRGGTWDHTSYFVLMDGKEIAEKWTLQSAKEYAERLLAEYSETHE